MTSVWTVWVCARIVHPASGKQRQKKQLNTQTDNLLFTTPQKLQNVTKRKAVIQLIEPNYS